jgi:hypothetical protein
MKPDTCYSPLIDRDFVFELAKRGKVSLCTAQISVECQEGRDANLDGLVIPPNHHLEYLYVHGNRATLRFAVEDRGSRGRPD